ncbi:MAG: helix-turn-helix domain-containing protein [Bacteroidia bacterium]|nr:helix-turn-helix domain-containing protein [Bacteroidia bacterium]
MKYVYKDELTKANLALYVNEEQFAHSFFTQNESLFLTLAWNRGNNQKINIDGQSYTFLSNTFLPLIPNQTFSFENPQQLTIWQFDKPFYCIQDFDHEVSCIGYLFWGDKGFFNIQLDEKSTAEIELIFQMFVFEIQNKDNVQQELQRALLKRLILKLNSLAQAQEPNKFLKKIDRDIVRHFNVLVEKHFREFHQVQDYATLLNKSPKSLSNLFKSYNSKTPLQIIHDRIILEAQRLLLYTNQSVKEIAFELGFEEVAHFSRLFRKITGLAPSEFTKTVQSRAREELVTS